MPKYKHGKIEEPIDFEEILRKVSAASKFLTLENIAFFWLLYWCGVRKSEAYERVVEDCQITPEFFIIDFHQRKKHGATVKPLKLPRFFSGVDLLCEQLRRASERKLSRKQISYTPEKGVQKTKNVRAKWLFPHINRSWAGVIVKKILGEEYYPHFLRLNRLTEIGKDPTANIVRIKSYSGIKSTSVLDSYLGTSEKEQDAAISYMAKQIERRD